MTPRPNNRVVQSGDTVTRTRPVVGASQPKEHKPATIQEILGRDPRVPVMAGGTRLVRIGEMDKEQAG